MNANKAAQLALEVIEKVNIDHILVEIRSAALEGKGWVNLKTTPSPLECCKLQLEGYKIETCTVSWLEEA